ncbi:MAG: branched-chain amino acid ABC transporter permease [Anaerolineae bacterium]|nr:branched-chain amino acid ABC transporter permease [Anaerolineae bacterium]
MRLRDIYLAIATIGFGEVVRIMALNFDDLVESFIKWMVQKEILFDSLISRAETSDMLDITIRDNGNVRVNFELLGGARGIKGIPVMAETWMLVLFLIIVIYFIIRLHRSRLGRAMAAIRQDEQAASNMGIDVVYVKNVVFVLSAMIAAAAGGLSGHLTRIIDPSKCWHDLVVIFSRCFRRNHWRPVIGAMVLRALPETLRGFSELRGLINGLILLGAIVYLPSGLVDIKGFRGLVAYFHNNRTQRKEMVKDNANT